MRRKTKIKGPLKILFNNISHDINLHSLIIRDQMQRISSIRDDFTIHPYNKEKSIRLYYKIMHDAMKRIKILIEKEKIISSA